MIKTFCDAVAKPFRPQKTILFGSYACKKPTEDLDVDLLVIMKRPRCRGERMRALPHCRSLRAEVRRSWGCQFR
jgi:predicted nucleotidyltransferase